VLATAPRKIRESIYSPVAHEAYGNFDLASAHESFCEYRKYMNPRFPRQTIRASMTMHPSVTADSDEVPADHSPGQRICLGHRKSPSLSLISHGE
jgi:hypothetical protein